MWRVHYNIYCFSKWLSIYYLLLLFLYNYLLFWWSSLQYIAWKTIFLQYFCQELGHPTIILKIYGFLGSNSKALVSHQSLRAHSTLHCEYCIYSISIHKSQSSQSICAFNIYSEKAAKNDIEYLLHHLTIESPKSWCCSTSIFLSLSK